jgi:hypothetical protein
MISPEVQKGASLSYSRYEIMDRLPEMLGHVGIIRIYIQFWNLSLVPSLKPMCSNIEQNVVRRFDFSSEFLGCLAK